MCEQAPAAGELLPFSNLFFVVSEVFCCLLDPLGLLFGFHSFPLLPVVFCARLTVEIGVSRVSIHHGLEEKIERFGRTLRSARVSRARQLDLDQKA